MLSLFFAPAQAQPETQLTTQTTNNPSPEITAQTKY